MIKEAYVSFEVAKLLKEKGFNGLCGACFDPNDKSLKTIYYNTSGEVEPQDWNNLSRRESGKIGLATWYGYISAPTHQMAMAWLREEKNIFIVIEPHAYDYVNEKNKSYVCSLWVGDKYYEYLESRDYPSYEKTVETALKYCLEHLI